ncbi:GTPase-activating Rap/Ran-GAP domain-like protein 3 isoform X1 [Talpa occidentalis]|uniref:GTPase-activating Rap/Ran-GAP domain-like protein 3 isoform X1 n=2 Tax=Talpa occidentalis TaxID=50954 RepID=UPI00188EB714|nr:GTPase-activating Rap/Ran-GAP domain-like protein 3 isoform X1 [Talpa occidentalis]XP_054544751.1 GTPase-activating Rap/Ran-GAP domain-like protein 3 isoform X1 [Talpa occidentalis]XP_054544752.1 GTPase-activating Rap/Ran-GAP domain-like protein 3 isoform X1 [Talpa occidentalis]
MDPLTKGSGGSQMAQTLLWKAKSSLSFGIQPLQTWPTKDPEVESQVNLSVSEDLGCRRGDFSRKHYGSVELLISSDADGAIQRAGRFRVENGSSDENATALPGTWRRTDVHLENPEYHTRWYFKYFLGQVHQNYIGNDAEKSPFFLSVTLSDQNNQRVPQYRAILWRKTGTQKICLPYSPTKTLSVKSILSAMNLDKFEKGPREIFHPEIQKDLLVLEEQEGSVNFKFGVLFAKDGQLTDDEMFSNEVGSDAFQKFLHLLGDTITLKGWTGYRGGLDTKNDTTGISSVYTVYQGHEIMFHVSTMLPYSKENKQQVERKRHIGNDIVAIVFQEGEEPSPAFKPSMIRSHFTHIFALVRYDQQNDNYRLKIFSEESVPLFGPPLPSPPVFTDHQEFRDFLLVKLINGEKATLETPTFAQKRRRTLDMLIRSLHQDLMPDLHKNMLNRRSFSDVLPESPKSARKKEEARQAEFVRIGQALKLKSIVRGDAPSSLAASGICKKEPWEPQCFCSSFPHEAVCADPWGQALLVSTDAGVLLVDDDLPSVPVFDRTLPVKQMHVLETLDLLLLRADKGKDARLFVFRLSAVQKGITNKQAVRSRCDCRDNKLEKTKGCHLYAINTHHSRELRIVVAIRNKLLLITRKPGGAAGATLLSPLSESPIEEFQYIREICLSDSPAVMTLVDGPTEESDNLICVAYRHQFDVVNESTGEAFRLHHVEASRVHFVAAIDVYEDGEAGLLLCYNYSCIYKKVCPFNGGSFLVQPSASDFQFCWNQAPYAIVCAFPYLLAFTTDSMEIRLVVNGNLVHTAVVPQLQLVASRSDIYFTAAATVRDEVSSGGNSKGTSAHNSPQTPPGRDTPVFPSSLGEGEIQSKNLYKIPLRNLVGRSIERPLKSPLVSKVITPPTSIGLGIAAIPVTHSLSLSRMEIKEIASRTRRELLGLSDEGGPRSEGAPKVKPKVRKRLGESQGGPTPGAVRSTSSDRITSGSLESPSSSEANPEARYHSASSDQDPGADREGSPVWGGSSFPLPASSDEDIIDLK